MPEAGVSVWRRAVLGCICAGVFLWASAADVAARTTSCSITVNRIPIATSGAGSAPPAPNPEPIGVPVDRPLEITLDANDTPVDPLAIELRFGALPVRLPSLGTPTGGTDTYPIEEFALFGTGLYEVAGSVDDCHFAAWVRVEGRSALTTIPGVAALIALAVGVTAAGSGLLTGMRRVGRPGLRRSIAGGAIAGGGALVLAQQSGMVPLDPTNLVTWTVGPGAAAGLAHIALAGMIGNKPRSGRTWQEPVDWREPPDVGSAGTVVGAEPQPVPDHPAPRWLSALVLDDAGGVLQQAFRAGVVNYVVVDIGPLRADAGRLTATGEESIDASLPEGQPHQLVIAFEIPDLGVLGAQPLTLPATGVSDSVVFSFRAPPQGATVRARIAALYANRVLQTAELEGVVLDEPQAAPPGFELAFRLAAVRPGLADLDVRRPFDAAVLGGHLPDRQPTAMSISGLAVARFDDQGLAKASSNIIALLTDLADHPERFADGLDSQPAVDLIRALAFEGRALHDVLGRGIVEQLPGAELSRLQVVSEPEDFIPVEFIYDGPVPAFGAGLCSNWRNALLDGACSPANHPVDEVTGLSSVVCPSGFWAITKVVERQVVAEQRSRLELDGAEFAIVAGPSPDRPHLRAFTSGLFAASRKVRAEDADAVLAALSEATGGRSVRVATWSDWIKRVASDEPALLVLLSHSTRTDKAIALEIEDGEQYAQVAITNSFVAADPDAPPVVLLLGCETANADRDLQSFVGRIKESGAALVVGTIAPVLGRHAAPVARALIIGLHQAGRQAAAADAGVADAPAGTFGDVMLRLRRGLLADGHLMALCLTSFGDADWQLASAAEADPATPPPGTTRRPTSRSTGPGP